MRKQKKEEDRARSMAHGRSRASRRSQGSMGSSSSLNAPPDMEKGNVTALLNEITQLNSTVDKVLSELHSGRTAPKSSGVTGFEDEFREDIVDYENKVEGERDQDEQCHLFDWLQLPEGCACDCVDAEDTLLELIKGDAERRRCGDSICADSIYEDPSQKSRPKMKVFRFKANLSSSRRPGAVDVICRVLSHMDCYVLRMIRRFINESTVRRDLKACQEFLRATSEKC